MKDTCEASLDIENDGVPGCSWYATGLEMNQAWTAAAELGTWASVDWNQSWMMTHEQSGWMNAVHIYGKEMHADGAESLHGRR